MNKKAYPKPYKRGNFWYICWQIQGERHRISTGCQTLRDAEEWVHTYFTELRNPNVILSSTLKKELTKYTDISTNPRRRDKLFSGQSYGVRYSFMIARQARDLLEVLPKNLLEKNLRDVQRVEIKSVSVMLISKFGRTTKAVGMFKLLKVALQQACDDGFIEASPAIGLSDIKAEIVKPAYALPAEDIALVISHPEYSPCRIAYLLFVMFVTTGMRKSEGLAVMSDQLDGDVLNIDRAFKDDKFTTIGLPKWNKSRSIWMSKLAKDAITELLEIGDGRVPKISSRTLALWFKTIGEHASNDNNIIDKKGWKKLNPHALRHSLNTALRLQGISDILVAEYMSWQHQDENRMQARYTHIYGRNTIIVAQTIDAMFSTV